MSQAAPPALSLWDNILFNVGYVIPMGLQGSFTRNPFWVGLLSRVHPDPAAVDFVRRLRTRYTGDPLEVRFLTTKALLVLDQSGVRRVLDSSPLIYADGRAKREGMSVFQPNAVTISRGDDWRDRRRFNEAVLDSEQPVHTNGEALLKIIREEVVEPVVGPPPTLQAWHDFDRLFARIMRRVIFGPSARDDMQLTDLLRQLLLEANRPIRPKKSRHFEPFYARIRAYLQAAEPGSLVEMCRRVPSSERTRVENQIPHWMFAMWETLAANTVRALAVILAHPLAEQRVREEMAASELTTSAGIDRLPFLEGCVQDAMRLWPTTPLLVREALVEDQLEQTVVAPGTQVLIWNSFNHRDADTYQLADTFAPEAWTNGRPSPLFNHLSQGPQVCAGSNLLLFIAKAVIASILDSRRPHLVQPRLDPHRPMPYAFNVFDVQFD